MHAPRAFIPLVLAALPLFASGCASPSTETAGGSVARSDAIADVGRWTLQGATDPEGRRLAALLPDGQPVHAVALDAGSISVHGGCNRMTGTYRYAPNGDVVVAPMASTRMACADQALAAADAAIATLLEGSAGFRVAESWPDQLTLDHDDGSHSHWVADRGVR